MKDQTRVFFVVDSIEDNEELFEVLEEARAYQDTLRPEDKPRIRICLVRHAFLEDEKEPMKSDRWNYEDLSDTFKTISETY